MHTLPMQAPLHNSHHPQLSSQVGRQQGQFSWDCPLEVFATKISEEGCAHKGEGGRLNASEGTGTKSRWWWGKALLLGHREGGGGIYMFISLPFAPVMAPLALQVTSVWAHNMLVTVSAATSASRTGSSSVHRRG